jgi:hypothetical protein
MAFNNILNLHSIGIQSLDSSGVSHGRTLQVSNGLTISNADGSSGNPTLGLTAEGASLLYSGASNVTGDGTEYTIPFNYYLSPTNSNYDTSTGIYTFPTTGWYNIGVAIAVSGLLVGHTELKLIGRYNTGDSLSYQCSPFPISTAGGVLAFSATGVTYQLAGATTKAVLKVSGSTKTVNLVAYANAFGVFRMQSS